MSIDFLQNKIDNSGNVVFLGYAYGVADNANFTIVHNKNIIYSTYLCLNITMGQFSTRIGGVNKGSSSSYISSTANNVVFKNTGGFACDLAVYGSI